MFVLAKCILFLLGSQTLNSQLALSVPMPHSALPQIPPSPYCHAPTPIMETYESIPNATLQQLHLFIRHGDRSPIHFIPRYHLEEGLEWHCADPYQGLSSIEDAQGNDTVTHVSVTIPKNNPYRPFSNLLWNGTCDLGMLTTRGASQHQFLGQQLRNVYVSKLGFLPGLMNSSIMNVRSSNYWRTKESVKNLFSKLYPASSRADKEELQLYLYPAIVENLYPRDECPAQTIAKMEVEASRGYREATEKISATLEKAKRIFGTTGSPTTIEVINNYYDTIQARLCHGLPLPTHNGENFTALDIEAIQNFGDFEISYLYRNGGAAAVTYESVGISNLMNEVFSRLRNPNSTERFFVYSGHDSTLSLLLGALNAKNITWPPYASNMLFELWKSDNGQFLVRVVYNGETLQTADGWCDFDLCTMDTFENFFASTLQIDLEDVCKPPKSK